MQVYVGAYAAAPKPAVAGKYEPALERQFFAALRDLEGVKGLELPFYGSLHPHDVDAYLGNLNPAWRFVLTGLPGTMNALAQDPLFGIASDAMSGRAAALEFYRRLRDSVALLNSRFGRDAVECVELHTAPKQGAPGVTASTEALVDSLREIRNWDWYGAKLAIEHCDAYVPGQVPQKGFLRIEQELDALAATGATRTPARLLLNWGRSAIEGRSAETPLAHAQIAKERGLLCGLMYSGACAKDTAFGDWQDTHAPFAPAFGISHGAEHSELTAARGRAWLQAGAGTLEILGFKIQPLPPPAKVGTRIEFLRDAIHWMASLSE